VQLHQWLEAQFAEKKTEPNLGLGTTPRDSSYQPEIR